MTLSRPLLFAKLKALAAHLSISLLLVGLALALMLWRWFPTPLFTTDGGGIGLKLLLLVDLVLGPLLTFVVFNPAKKLRETVIDLGAIAVLQLAAFGFGLWTIHGVRVQAVAFHEGQFQSVTADSFKQQKIAPKDWRALGVSAPYVVDVRQPANGDEQGGVVAFGLTEGLAPHQLHFLYQPIGKAPEVISRGWTMAELQQADGSAAQAAAAWATEQGFAAPFEALRFYPVEGFYDSAVLVLDDQAQWLGGYAGKVPKKPAAKL